MNDTLRKIKVERAAIEIFGGCNYKCVMCPQTAGRGASWTRKMRLEHFVYLLNQLDGHPLIQLEGSGEAFLAKDLHLYVQECSDRGFDSFVKTNGSFDKDVLNKVIHAGLTHIRFSVIGYDRDTYCKNMGVDNFDKVIENINYCKQVVDDSESLCQISLYHLLTDSNQQSTELEKYKEIADKLQLNSYVWKMHNWSGNIDINQRISTKKRTCGRPFAPEITIRAGGETGRFGAVTPCTQTLGPPNESKSVLGYTDKQSLYDIWNGELYNNLRQKHKSQKFEDISYCKDCDFLFDDPDVLVWTNDTETKLGHVQGTNLNLFEETREV